MKKILIFLIFLPVFMYGQDTIRLRDLGLTPGSRLNAVPFVNQAMEKCKGKSDIVLVFEKGRYDFWPQYANEKDYFISNTNYTYPRFCVFVVENAKHLTIDCGGSDFIFHGKLQPFTIDSSENIAIKNVSIDWEVPFGAEAEIIDVTPAYFDLKIDPKKYPYVLENDKLFFVGEGWKNLWGGVKWNDPMEFDRETLEVTAGTNDDLLGENWEKKYLARELGDGIVRITYNNNGLLKKGNYLVLRHGYRDHAGIFITDSKNVQLENINMYSNLGLSYLAQYSENLTYRNVNCLPNPGRKIISGHDDGLHFSNCRGQITVEGCTMKGLMDDSFNVHGSYVIVTEKVNDNTLVCKFPHFQSIGLVWARKGETVAFIDGQSMKNYGSGIVSSVRLKTPETFEVIFQEAVPKDIKLADALENISWEPDVTIRNCYFGNHRARGVLISSGGRIQIDGNTFESSGSAIVFPGDIKSYFENGPIKDATISNNLFKASCLTSMYMTCEAIISVSLEVPAFDAKNPPVHKNIKIFNNTFEMYDYPALYALSVDGISFNQNKLKFSNLHKPWHPRKYNLIFEACRNIEVKGNEIEKDVLGKNINLLQTSQKELKLGKGQGFVVE